MDGEITQSEQWLRFVAWLEDNLRRIIVVAAVLIGVGTVVAFILWQGGQKQRSASESHSFLLAQPQLATGEDLLAVADEVPGTAAGTRALLLGAAALYTEGRFEDAKTQFQRLLTETPAGPLTPKARFGVAACDEALGNVEAAISGYQSLVNSPASGNVIPQARLSLGNLYVEQGQPELARAQYESIIRLMGGTALAAEARSRLGQLPQAEVEPQPQPLLTPAPTGGTP
jgi:TolA-binding protein